MLEQIITETKNNLISKIETVERDVQNFHSDIIKSIIANGGKVKIVHERYVSDKELDPKTRREAVLAAKNAKSITKQKLAKEYLESLGVILERNSKSGEFHRHNVVYPFGGSTTVMITDGEKVFTETSYCSLSDSFNRRIGISNCFNRIVEKLSKELDSKIGAVS